MLWLDFKICFYFYCQEVNVWNIKRKDDWYFVGKVRRVLLLLITFEWQRQSWENCHSQSTETLCGGGRGWRWGGGRSASGRPWKLQSPVSGETWLCPEQSELLFRNKAVQHEIHSILSTFIYIYYLTQGFLDPLCTP